MLLVGLHKHPLVPLNLRNAIWERYKAGQDRFTNWLKETADRCTSSGTNDKAKAAEFSQRTFGKQKSGQSGQPKATVHWSELQDLAKTIVSNAPSSIPSSIVGVLKDVIALRKKSARFFARQLASGGDTLKRSYDGHEHIIRVLEDVSKVFEGVVGADISKGNGSSEKADAETRLNNLFGLLDIEGVEAPVENDDSDGLEAMKPMSTNGRKTPKPKKNSKGKKAKKPTPKALTTGHDVFNVEYEMEPDESDIYFLIYCFFEDFNEMRDYLQERWCDYKDGLLSLTAVSIITNTAFEMFQEDEKDLLRMLPRSTGLTSFEPIANMLFLEAGLAHVDYDALPTEKGPELDNAIGGEAEWVCLPVYWEMSRCLKSAPPGKVPVVRDSEKKEVKYSRANVDDKMHFTSVIMMELLTEAFILKALKFRDGCPIPAADELTLGLAEMIMIRHIPIWLVFACQVQVDIRYIMETDIDRGHKELVALGDRLRSSLDTYTESVKHLEIGSPRMLKTLRDEIDCWIIVDFIGACRNGAHRNVGIPEAEIEPFFYLRRSPILCGLMTYKFDLTYNQVGLQIINAWGTAIAMAHIYNIIRQERPSSSVWPDMEAVLAMQGGDYLFVGSRPSKTDDYFKRWELATGASAKMFAGKFLERPYSRHEIQISPDGPRGLTNPSLSISEVLYDRFCYSWTEATPSTLHALRKSLTPKAPQRALLEDIPGLKPLSSTSQALAPLSEYTALSYDNSKASPAYPQWLTPVQLFDGLSSRLSHEEIILSFDYLSFHDRCTRLLRVIAAEFESEILDLRDEPIKEVDAQLPLLTRYLAVLVVRGWKDVPVRLERITEGIIAAEGNIEILKVKERLALDSPRYV